MARAYKATLDGGDYSDIVLGRVHAFGDTGWNFKELTMTFTPSLVAGLLVKEDGTPVASASEAADIYGVLVDRKVLPGVTPFAEEGDVVSMVVAVRGLTLNALKLVYADKTAIDSEGTKVIEAKGNLVTKHIVGTEFLGSVL